MIGLSQIAEKKCRDDDDRAAYSSISVLADMFLRYCSKAEVRHC